jgi:uncharacterized protein (DUF736 family)
MSKIGTFTKQDDGFNGTLRTLSTSSARSFRSPGTTAAAPTTASSRGAVEIGTAWIRHSKANKEYLSVKIDDPIAPTRKATS